jgi:hypothetical protein
MLTLLAAAGGVAWAFVRRRRAVAAAPPPVIPEDACEVPPPPRRWGGAVPAAVLAAMFAARVVVALRPAPSPMPLYESASRAYAEGRFADAAEYARHALGRASGSPLRPELLCLRGEGLLRAGEPSLAADAFDAVVGEGSPAYLAQALSGSARAHQAAGEEKQAEASRSRLMRDFPDSAWARRARSE